MARTAMPLQWHRECALATRQTLADYQQRLANLEQLVERLRADAEFYDKQVAVATQRGLEGFDRDRFLVPRKRKATK